MNQLSFFGLNKSSWTCVLCSAMSLFCLYLVVTILTLELLYHTCHKYHDTRLSVEKVGKKLTIDILFITIIDKYTSIVFIIHSYVAFYLYLTRWYIVPSVWAILESHNFTDCLHCRQSSYTFYFWHLFFIFNPPVMFVSYIQPWCSWLNLTRLMLNHPKNPKNYSFHN